MVCNARNESPVNAEIIFLRLLHIVPGVIWVGGIIFFAFVLQPALLKTGSEHFAPVMQKLLKPMQGWVRIRGGSTLAGSQDKIDVTFVGDGERFWLLDHVRKQRIKTGRGFDNLEMFLPHFLPLDFWLEGSVPSWDANSVQFFPPDEAFRGLKGLGLTEDKGWKTLWFDSKGNTSAWIFIKT